MVTKNGRIAETNIEIAGDDLQVLSLRLIGTSPLLSNAPSKAMLDEMELVQMKKITKPKAKDRVRDPEAEWNGTRHIAEGFDTDVWPTLAVQHCFVAAGMRFCGLVGTQLRGAFTVLGDWLPLDAPPPTCERHWGRLADTGHTFNLIYRAKYWPWALTVPIMYNPRTLTQEQLVKAAHTAGISVGLGGFRKENKGIYGSFRLEGVNESGS